MARGCSMCARKASSRPVHVPGTINVSRGRLEFRIWKPLGYPGRVDMNRKIYVQCATGGLAAWQKSGYPFVQDEAK
jgi:hypothetical protein